jgi:hypothetical protein
VCHSYSHGKWERAVADSRCKIALQSGEKTRGFAVETHDSGEYRYVRGKLLRNRERISVRGLSDNYNRDLKNLFKSTAISASTRPGPATFMPSGRTGVFPISSTTTSPSRCPLTAA